MGAAAWNYRLKAGSPCIDKGTTNPPVNTTGPDLDGKTRVVGAGIDLGAYEYAPPALAGTLIVLR